MRRIMRVVFITIILLMSCRVESPLQQQQFADPFQALLWVSNNIQYEAEPEGQDVWQSPETTYDARKGDCEDRVILLMYFVQHDKQTSMVVLQSDVNGERHAVMLADDVFWDVQSHSTFSPDSLMGWEEVARYSYDEVMRIVR